MGQTDGRAAMIGGIAGGLIAGALAGKAAAGPVEIRVPEKFLDGDGPAASRGGGSAQLTQGPAPAAITPDYGLGALQTADLIREIPLQASEFELFTTDGTAVYSPYGVVLTGNTVAAVVTAIQTLGRALPRIERTGEWADYHIGSAYDFRIVEARVQVPAASLNNSFLAYISTGTPCGFIDSDADYSSYGVTLSSDGVNLYARATRADAAGAWTYEGAPGYAGHIVPNPTASHVYTIKQSAVMVGFFHVVELYIDGASVGMLPIMTPVPDQTKETARVMAGLWVSHAHAIYITSLKYGFIRR